MTPEEFAASFETIAEAPGGIRRLREMVLGLALHGKLIAQRPGDEPVSALLKEINGVRGEGGQLDAVQQDDVPALPESWCWVPVGQVADCVLGKMLDKAKHRKGQPRPYLRNMNVRWGSFDMSDLLTMYFEDEEMERYGVKVGDVLVCEGGEPGRAAIWGDPSVTMLIQKAIHRVRLCGGILPEWLLMNLRYDAWTKRLERYFTGATIKHFTGKALVGYRIRLPSISEQRRIVAKVAQLMALCDDLEARQAKGRNTVAELSRASLEALTSAETPVELEAAFQRIVANFGPISGAAERVEALRAATLGLGLKGWFAGPQSRRDAWRRAKLGELCEFITSGSRSWKEFYADAGAVFIRSQDIRTDALDLRQPAFVRVPEKTEGTRTRARRGDVLVTITGANVGKTALIDVDPPEAYVSQHVALIRLKDPSNAPWVHRWLKSPAQGRGALLGASYGDKPGLNLENLRSLPIEVPPGAQQAQILANIDRLLALCDTLEAALRRSESTAARLVEAVVAEMVAA